MGFLAYALVLALAATSLVRAQLADVSAIGASERLFAKMLILLSAAQQRDRADK